MNKTVLIIMLIWGVGLLSLAWSTLKTFKDGANEKLLFKAVALVLTIAFAPVLSILQVVWTKLE